VVTHLSSLRTSRKNRINLIQGLALTVLSAGLLIYGWSPLETL
jgi:hypothetical protein